MWDGWVKCGEGFGMGWGRSDKGVEFRLVIPYVTNLLRHTHVLTS